MTTRTRYFVITSSLVLFIGVGTGLVAYYVGFPGGVFQAQTRVADLQMLPRDAHLVAYANVREVMRSELREKLRQALPISGQGQQELADRTGINLETDIEEVIACLAASSGDQRTPPPVLVLARGIFDTSRIEGMMLQHGARIEQYKGARIIVAGQGPVGGPATDLQGINSFGVAFIAPGLAALGSTSLIRAAVDQKGSGPGVTENAELMSLVRAFDGGHAWAVGHFAALASQAHLPAGLAGQLPPITWFAANAQVDSGVRGTLRADARDAAAADNLREIVRGFIALVRLQTASVPDLNTFVDSLTLGGTGTTVSLTYDIPGQLVDRLGSLAGSQKRPEPPQ
jgi:hypothetical protein